MLWSGLLASEPISHSGQPCSVTGPRNIGSALPGRGRGFRRSPSSEGRARISRGPVSDFQVPRFPP